MVFHFFPQSRGDWIRTSGLLLPKQARYQLRHAPTLREIVDGVMKGQNPARGLYPVN